MPMQAMLVTTVACAILAITAIVAYCRYSEANMLRRLSILSQSAAVSSMRVVMPAVNRELGRARRYERPLCVAVVEVRSDELRKQIAELTSQSSVASIAMHRRTTHIIRVVFALIGSVLQEATRETDIVAYDPESDRYVLVLPDVNRAEAEQASERIREMLLKRTAARTAVGIAEFPGDGLSFEDLVARAASGLEAGVGDLRERAAA